MDIKLPKNISEFYENIEKEAITRWENTTISIMVFGPDVNSTNNSAVLRKHLTSKCREIGLLVRTEHEDFQEAYKKLLGTNHNLCFFEYNAAKHVDALVIIPDSPGSFVELGMFSFIPSICEKTLLLFSHNYMPPEKQLNFVFLGPKLAYQERHATVKFVDYTKPDFVWDIVNNFIHERQAVKWDQSIIKELSQ